MYICQIHCLRPSVMHWRSLFLAPHFLKSQDTGHYSTTVYLRRSHRSLQGDFPMVYIIAYWKCKVQTKETGSSKKVSSKERTLMCELDELLLLRTLHASFVKIRNKLELTKSGLVFEKLNSLVSERMNSRVFERMNSLVAPLNSTRSLIFRDFAKCTGDQWIEA